MITRSTSKYSTNLLCWPNHLAWLHQGFLLEETTSRGTIYIKRNYDHILWKFDLYIIVLIKKKNVYCTQSWNETWRKEGSSGVAQEGLNQGGRSWSISRESANTNSSWVSQGLKNRYHKSKKHKRRIHFFANC